MGDEEFMRLAIDKAKEGIEQGAFPFGACIVKDGQVISCVHNVTGESMDPTAHAEVHAIRVACKKLGSGDLSGCVIYSTCEPCPMCFGACHWAKISKIVYGSRIEDSEKVGSMMEDPKHGAYNELTSSNQKMKDMGNSPIEIVGDFLREESLELFSLWCRKKGKEYQVER